MSKTIQLKWITQPNGEWYNFYDLGRSGNCSRITDCGVYLIFTKKNVIRVGQGIIKDRFSAHFKDNEIRRRHNPVYPLLTTWASLPESYRDGVEAYLAWYYQPLVGERFPDVKPIAVNFP